ncbi:MAG TPA: bifunctional enoyl-CoA hydratase/phosphate acetyltransferase [bacterium]|nr:bifunctional enoyl-CoA hydratase/phosphate acetyltransferase [bacterium]
MTEDHFTGLIQRVKDEPSRRIALAGADDPTALEAVDRAHREGLAEATLVGDPAAIEANAANLGVDLEPFEMVASADAAGTAASLVGGGRSDVLMKGSVASKAYLRAVLNEDNGLRTGRLLSHVMVAAVPAYHKLLFLTDAAFNIAPTLAEKADIIRNAVDVARILGVGRPKVAVLAAVEKVNLPDMPATGDAAALTVMARRGQLGDCIVDGPLAFDNAVSRESARIKGIESEVAGDADVLLCPDIESANILYKCLIHFSGARAGAVIVGAAAPVVLPSRADDAMTKYLSIVTAMAIAGG